MEVESVNAFVNGSLRSSFDLVMAFHSYGQILIYPWAYTDQEDPDNIEDLVTVNNIVLNSKFMEADKKLEVLKVYNE